MYPKNREKFELAGILRWHEAGYTGRGVKVATLESQDSWHGRWTADIIKQIAPDAEVVYRSEPSIVSRSGKLTDDTVERLRSYYQGLVDEGTNIVSMSKGGTSAEPIEDLQRSILHANGITMLTSAGNTGKDIRSNTAAFLDTWIAVGMAFLSKAELKRDRYSSTGPQLDVMSFTGLYTEGFPDLGSPVGAHFQGTSCACPAAAGMLALWFGRFRELNGRYPTPQESYEFITDNVRDMEAAGFDEKTGYGLFVLPDPATIRRVEVMPQTQPLVYIDAGHGGVDSGAIDKGLVEKELNLRVAQQVRDILQSHGVDVAMARNDDSGEEPKKELWRRTNEANRLKAKAYISIHHNWIDLPKVNGIEVYHSVNEGPGGDLARKILAEMIDALPMESRGVKQRAASDGVSDYYHVIRETDMSAVITECGYLSSPKDAEIMKHTDFIVTEATAIARGVLLWLGIAPTVKRVLSMTMKEAVDVFKDVPDDHWAAGAVKRVAEAGLLVGNTDGTFKGDEPVTRYQLAAVLDRLLSRGGEN